MKRGRSKSFKWVVVGGVLLAIAAGLGWWVSSVRTFRFLDGREVVDSVASGHVVIDYYHFEGDFNDVCAEASAELLARGFSADNRGRPMTHGSANLRKREIRFHRSGKGGPASVRIRGIEPFGVVKVQAILPRRPSLRKRLERLIGRLRDSGRPRRRP